MYQPVEIWNCILYLRCHPVWCPDHGGPDFVVGTEPEVSDLHPPAHVQEDVVRLKRTKGGQTQQNITDVGVHST